MERWLFFSKVCVFINLLGHKKNWSYYFHSNCQKNLRTLMNCSLRFLILDNTRKKKTPKIFNYWKNCLFFKTLWFQQPPRSLKKCSGKLYSISRNSVWTLVSCSLRLITPDNTGKKGQIFCHLKTAFFWNVCFYRPLKSQRKDDIFWTIIVEIPRGLL